MLKGLLVRRRDYSLPTWDDDLWWFEDPYLPEQKYGQRSLVASDDDEQSSAPDLQHPLTSY